MSRPTRDPEPLPHVPPLELRRAQEERLARAWANPPGWRYWSAVNNQDVGLWYVAAAFAFFLFGGILALLLRVQLATPENTFLSAETYNALFTLHGSIMMFLFAVPVFEAFSIMVLPQMLGARDLPFPRLSAFGLWSFVLGGVFFCGSLFFDVAPRGGWFMYPPLTSAHQPDLGADIWLLGLSFIEVAAIAAAVELIVGILKTRPPGMRVNLLPLYAWYLLVAAVMVLFAFPPLIAASLLLELERAFGWPFFDPSRGGDPLLWQHLFWIFGHPEVYIVFLPSIALVAMIVPTFARTPIVGYGWIVLAAVGTGFLSFGLWVHHMFTTGLPGISLAFFTAASQAIALPTGVQIFCFLATLLAGTVTRSVPILFVFGGMATFVLGGLTGVMVALAPFDLQAHDTFFVVGHLHSVLIGGSIFPLAAGFTYFYPLVTERTLSERLGRVAFWLMFAGFNATFLPMHFTGLRGMPRRVFTYPEGLGLETLNLVSSIGAFVLAAGIAVFAFDVLRPKRREPRSARNPWRAGTLEWLAEMEGRSWGVRSIPEIDSRYPLWDQPDFVRHVDEGRFYLPDAEEGWRETLVTSVIDAVPAQCLRLPGSTFLTFWAAMGTGGIFIFATFHWWWAMAASGVFALGTILVWLWTGTALIPEKKQKAVGLGLTLPLYASGPDSVGWWAMLITMLGMMAAFASLIFAYFFYWTVHDDVPPEPSVALVLWPLAGCVLLLGAWAATLHARRSNREDHVLRVHVALAAGCVLSAGGAAALVAGPSLEGLDPTAHAYAATVWALALWTVIGAVVGIIMQLYCIARRVAGRMSAEHDIDIANVVLYWHFVAITAVVAVATIALFPLVR
jgi:cytochrome c oxidase subunit I+III